MGFDQNVYLLVHKMFTELMNQRIKAVCWISVEQKCFESFEVGGGHSGAFRVSELKVLFMFLHR